MKIADIIKYVEGWSEGFSSRIVPADSIDLDELLPLAEHPLPPLYIDYLHAMGDDCAEFDIGKWTLNPGDVADYASFYGSYSKAKYTMFAKHLADPGEVVMHWYFDHRGNADHRGSADKAANGASLDLPVVRFTDNGVSGVADGEVSTVFGSFRELLLSFVFQICCLESRPFKRQLQFQRVVGEGNGEQMDVAIDIAQKLGFTPPLPPEPLGWMGEAGDTAVLISRLHRPSATTFFLDIASSSELDGGRVVEIFRDHLE